MVTHNLLGEPFKLTVEQIINEPAGDKIDTWISVNVLRHMVDEATLDEWKFRGGGSMAWDCRGRVEKYSSEDESANKILNAVGNRMVISNPGEEKGIDYGRSVSHYWAELFPKAEYSHFPVVRAGGETRALAICRAALLALTSQLEADNVINEQPASGQPGNKE